MVIQITKIFHTDKRWDDDDDADDDDDDDNDNDDNETQTTSSLTGSSWHVSSSSFVVVLQLPITTNLYKFLSLSCCSS